MQERLSGIGMDYDATTHRIRCIAHIFNLAVQAMLRRITQEAFEGVDQAASAEYTSQDLSDPVMKLRGLVAAVSDPIYLIGLHQSFSSCAPLQRERKRFTMFKK